ncbi:hypothetical protein CP10139811_0815 [Chlamydia ibidis]|uniref:Uncharacterized protein n=2 Tax=Chlamydia ibidis TaxID=1405396 RepID=S7J2A9_9CHLA|nr:hypothetical protein [Chlamydia ibidis]EPP34559.1 hypothetical protein CP10139811_0815 [Chlamydia ibidis]EQM62964.1 hypothetical protein H359_0134 [Chlamydia ibidis 10-1398/6]
MGINPTGNNKNDAWISGAHEQHPDVENTQSNMGDHSISTNGDSTGILSRIASSISSLIAKWFGGSSASSSSRRDSVSSQSSLKESIESGHDTDSLSDRSSISGESFKTAKTAFSDEFVDSMSTLGSSSETSSFKFPSEEKVDHSSDPVRHAGSNLIKKGYTPGKKVDIPTLPPQAMNTGAAVKRQAPQPPQQRPVSSGSVVENLKSQLQVHKDAKQAKLDGLSSKVRERWTNLETTNTVAYTLSGLQTLGKSLETTRQNLSSLSFPQMGVRDQAIKNSLSLAARGLTSLGMKEKKQDGESALLSIVVGLAITGPTLSSEEKVTDYVKQMIDEQLEGGYEGVDPEEEPWVENLMEYAANIDHLRSAYPDQAPKFWESLVLYSASSISSLSSSEKSAHVGSYNDEEIQSITSQNTQDLAALRAIDQSVYSRTLTILASDLL